jgi:S-(hydroxymethyl)glutathione synthase
MFLEVDPFPAHVLVHVPALDRDSDIGGEPDRRVFTDSKLELVQIPEDGLPQYPGWGNSPVHPGVAATAQ